MFTNELAWFLYLVSHSGNIPGRSLTIFLLHTCIHTHIWMCLCLCICKLIVDQEKNWFICFRCYLRLRTYNQKRIFVFYFFFFISFLHRKGKRWHNCQFTVEIVELVVKSQTTSKVDSFSTIKIVNIPPVKMVQLWLNSRLFKPKEYYSSLEYWSSMVMRNVNSIIN